MRANMLLFAIAAVVGTLGITPTARAELLQVDRRGNISTMRLGAEYVDVSARLSIPLRGWQSARGTSDAEDIKSASSATGQVVSGRIRIADGRYCRFEQTVREAGGAATVSVSVLAEQDLDIEGVFLNVDVPIRTFAGGLAELAAPDGQVQAVPFPGQKPDNRHFLNGTASTLRMTAPGGALELTMTADRPCQVNVQDTRDWNGTVYNTYWHVNSGPMQAGQSAQLGLTFQLIGQEDRAPARLSVDASRELYRLDGFGGDYCFNIDSPVTQYTLDNLKSGWIRTEMRPTEWEPENDNDDPDRTDWDKLKAMDTPDSMLRKRMLLAQQFHKRGIPYVISIWVMPEWLYSDPGRGPQAHGRHIPRENWPEMAECIGSYLVYAKERYGVEPDLFSFNEPDYGVRVKVTPEEHRDMIKFLGPYFDRLGLKTEMLLADVASCRGTQVYCDPTLADPEAMRCVGAVAFHSWGGASPEEYGAWRDVARRAGLPLLVTELGVDANWRAVPLDTFRYALREVQHYQDIIRYAQPQGTMQWEFTSDYSLLNIDWNTRETSPKKRFWFVKHFCNLTPTPGIALAAESNNDRVTITGFRGQEDGRTVYAFHISNMGAQRPATVTGLPPGLYRAIQTDEERSYEVVGEQQIGPGPVELELEANSLLTLTTRPL